MESDEANWVSQGEMLESLNTQLNSLRFQLSAIQDADKKKEIQNDIENKEKEI